jgi:ankyrin repeat protein
MNDVTRTPPPQGPDDVDDRYRRASAADPSGPSSAVRQAVLAHAAQVAAERKANGSAFQSWLKGIVSWLMGLSRGWSGPALLGTLAAAAFAGMMILPRVQMLHQAREAMEAPNRAESAQTAAPAPPSSEPVTVELRPPEHIPLIPMPPMGPMASPAIAPPASAPPPAAARSAAAPTAQQSATQQAAADVDSKASKALDEVVMTGSRITRDQVRMNNEFWRAAEEGDLAKLQSLMSQGVLVDVRDSKDRTALLLAVQHHHADIVNTLLDKDADPNLPDNKGNTPLKAALESGQKDLADALRRHGAE